MDRSVRGRSRLLRWLVVASLPWFGPVAPVNAAAPAPAGCPAQEGTAGGSGSIVTGPPELDEVFDARGWLVGHRLELPGTPGASVSLGRIAFLDGPFGARWVYGEVSGGVSRLRILDATRGCIETTLQVPGMVFSTTIDPSGAVLVHDVIDPGTREERGVWRRSVSGSGGSSRVLPGVPSTDPIAPVWANSFAWGPAGELAAQSCGAVVCVTRVVTIDGQVRTYRSARQGALIALTRTSLVTDDGVCHVEPCGTVSFARFGRRTGARINDVPRVDPRPVPENTPSTWPQDAWLSYRWAPDAPNAWMKPAINAAAADVGSSRGSLAPRFGYDAGGDDQIQLQAQMSGSCARSIACAYYDVPRSWLIRIRPQGTEVDWGTVRWCQAYDDPPNGCYDLEHVMVHEFGHVAGLAHPEDFGFRLGATETVMSATGEQKGEAGWQMHRFGPCDIARLQRRYDLINTWTSLALCDRVDTRLTLDVSSTSIGVNQPVLVTATLRIRDLDSYGRLGNDKLSGRDVTIERRPAGGGAWTSYTAVNGSATGTYVLSFRPSSSVEFRARFDRPAGEGLNDDLSNVITVSVGPCNGQGPCPENGSPIGDQRP